MVCVSTSLNTLACLFLFLASIAESEDGEAEGGYDPTKTVYPGKKIKESFNIYFLSFSYAQQEPNVIFTAVFLII